MFASLLRNALIKTLSLRYLASSRERWSIPGPEELKGSRIPMLQTCQAYGSSLPPVWKWSTCHGSGSKWEELWSRTHWTLWGNSILLTTEWLQFTLCSDIRKNFMRGQSQKKISFGQIYSKNKTPTTWQHLFILQELVYDYLPVQFVLPSGLPFGCPGPWWVSYSVLFASLPHIRKQRASHWCNKTLILAKVSGWGQVQLSWECPSTRSKFPIPPHPHEMASEPEVSILRTPVGKSWRQLQCCSRAWVL